MWEVLPYFSFMPRHKTYGIGIADFCLKSMTYFVLYPMIPRITTSLGKRTQSLALAALNVKDSYILIKY